MNEQTEIAPEPIRTRISRRLDELGQTSSWLAERAGVPRSTVSRILNDRRNPTAETLAELAPVLGCTLEELVAGTDAAVRVRDAKQWVDRSHLDEALRQVVAFESKANRLTDAVADLKREVLEERERRRSAEQRRDVAEQARDDATLKARLFERDARRYRVALERAVADVASLQTQVQELTLAAKQGRDASKMAAAFAGAAAVASIAAYLNSSPDSDDEDDEDDE